MGQSMLPISGGGVVDLWVGRTIASNTAINYVDVFVTQLESTPNIKNSVTLTPYYNSVTGVSSYPSWISDVKDGYVCLQWAGGYTLFMCGRINEPFTWDCNGYEVTTTFSIKNGSIYMENISADASAPSYGTTSNYPLLIFIRLA